MFVRSGTSPAAHATVRLPFVKTMDNPSPPPPPDSSTASLIGKVLSRAVVPAWILAGAAFKLYERNPGNLPSVIRDLSRSLHLQDLDLLLRMLIGCELFAVGVMFLLPRFARSMAIFMTSCFCLILIAEIIKGATSCGCFGSLPVKPWHMLTIDGLLLLGLIVFPSGESVPLSGRSFSARSSVAGALGIAIIIGIAAMAIAFGVPKIADTRQNVAFSPPATDGRAPQSSSTQPQSSTSAPASTQSQSQTQPQAGSPSDSAAPSNLPPTVNPHPKALPASWYTKEKPETWLGKPWRELDIFQLMPTWPRDMDKGKRYVIFYSRTCEHCEALLRDELIAPLDGLITLVQIPASRTVLTEEGSWEMPASVQSVLHAEMLALPLGPSWLIETPMVIVITDGKVTAADEGKDYKKILGLQ